MLTVHTPGAAEFLSPTQLALLKPTAVLVNCARGGVVNEGALLAALVGGRLSGAGLDVYGEEPPGPGSAGAALLKHPRVRGGGVRGVEGGAVSRVRGRCEGS